MILQEIIFPKKEICEDQGLYYRGEMNNNCINNDDIIKFNTYFNSFSIEKWRKYTIISNLSIILDFCGNGRINVKNSYMKDNCLVTEIVKSIEVEERLQKSVEIQVENMDLRGIIYFEIEAKKDFKFFGGKYITKVEDSETNDINLAICICTFKREEFVKRNINVFLDNIINNDKSQVFNHLEVFVVDNAQTLDEKDFKNPRVHYIKNKNVGGSGGFTRGIIEATFRSDTKYTNCILMDDDITLDSSTIEKTFAFLKILRDEFSEKMIGGAMLYQEQKYIQAEAGALWNSSISVIRNHNFDLRKEDIIVKNELDGQEINYNGWWYCCIPTKIITKDNLPLPIFIHMDDMEYGMRNEHGFILLNGICVWHPNLVNKGPVTNFYYNSRNMLILNSRYKKLGNFKFEFKLFMTVMYYLAQYKYTEIELQLKGINDYYLGIDNFKMIEGELLHKELLKYNYQKNEVDFNIDKEYKSDGIVLRILKSIKGMLSYLAPQFAKDKIYTSNIIVTTCFFAKRIAVYDVSSKKVLYLSRNYKRAKTCLKELWRIFKIIKKEDKKITKEWNNRMTEITNLDFWNQYLDMEDNK